MKYGLQLPTSLGNYAEGVWKDMLVSYDVMSAGAGTTEYTFRYATLREEACSILQAEVMKQCEAGSFNIGKGGKLERGKDAKRK